MKKICLAALTVCVSSLSGCMSMNEGSYTTYPPSTYDNNQGYVQNYPITTDYGSGDLAPSGRINVPDSYHIGAYRSPSSAKDQDRNWVSAQNPSGYTIEIADDAKASQVAKKLYQIPKNDRMAEIKYQRDGKEYYKGLYGSYSSQEEAQKALSTLPNDVKQNAGIKNWGSIQNNQ